MIQFYAKPEHINGVRLELHDDEAHHAKNVLRLNPGDSFWATDGLGNRYRVKATAVDRKQVTGEIQDAQKKAAQVPEVVLAISPTKQRSRLEMAVEKAVELGAHKIVLLQTQRTERSKIRMDRLETIVTTAMKQSLRVWRPEISTEDSFTQLLEQYSEEVVWIAHEALMDSDQHGLNSEKIEQFQKAKQVLLLIGPEGGFTDSEVEKATDHGAELVSLGPHRLRAETAAIAFLSLLLPLK